MSNVVYWFRNDLRLHDNEALVRATNLGNVTPVYVIDNRSFAQTSIGHKRTGKFRAKFLLETIADLKQNLQKIGSDLVIRIGHPEEIIAEIAHQINASHVVLSKEATQEETSVEAELSQLLKQHNIDIELIWTNTLYHPRDLPFQMHFLPDVFSTFRKKVESRSEVRATFPTVENLGKMASVESKTIPTLAEIGFESFEVDERAVLDFKGGETAGLQRLHYYLWESDLLKTYKETRNGLVGVDYSSKFSAWLSLGCLSPRHIYEEIKRYESERTANQSTYWLIFELIWRDFYHFIALKYGVRLFKRSGIKHDMVKEWNQDQRGFNKWVNGETGVPFIDANMREFKETGFMSNRGRQNVASFLTKDLGIEWWWGAMYFESLLVDYDVCSNWGNWNYVSGIGNDPREDRYFNITKQATNYDPEAEYMKLWLPELKDVPADKINEVGLLSQAEQKQYGVQIGVDYPNPYVDVKKWRKSAKW
ncbi:MAG: DASH family cryptochrome [Spirosomaceae bacterium]|nr:DASH family cryptochrome [Spirosomataceae bacterium]